MITFSKLALFESARIKLTVFYLIIIILISSLFSLVIYRLISQEFDRVYRIERQRLERQFPLPPVTAVRIYIDPEVIEESKQHLIWILVGVNLGIITISAFAGYFLAGKTLQPIKNMMDQQNQFITDASHELRTPLTAMKTEIEVSLRDKKLTLSEAKKMLESNLEEVNSLQNLSESMMRLSKITHDEPEEKLEPVSIRPEIESAIKKVNPLAKRKNIEIKNQAQDYPILAKKGLLSELMMILLDNAIKYSSPQTKITILTQGVENQVKIEVSDQGLGIPKEDLPQLFNRFFRSSKSRAKSEADGFGLGLSIAKKMVTSLNGRIEVASEEGKGTTFAIFLPKAYIA